MYYYQTSCLCKNVTIQQKIIIINLLVSTKTINIINKVNKEMIHYFHV